MSPFRLEISDHAHERLKQRRITRQQVRDCISNGELIGTDIRGRMINEKKIGKRVLTVVYLRTLGGYVIVTSYWRGIE